MSEQYGESGTRAGCLHDLSAHGVLYVVVAPCSNVRLPRTFCTRRTRKAVDEVDVVLADPHALGVVPLVTQVAREHHAFILVRRAAQAVQYLFACFGLGDGVRGPRALRVATVVVRLAALRGVACLHPGSVEVQALLMDGVGPLMDRAASYAQDGALALLSCLPCGRGASTIHVNGAEYEIVKLLGEGGFSLVYLVRDTRTGGQYALKQVRAPPDADPVSARRRVDARGDGRGRCDAPFPWPAHAAAPRHGRRG